jgi:hypothetical protein
MLPAAIAIALSPTGLVEMILVLLSARARLNALVFLASVMVSVFVLPLLGASILRAWANTKTTSPSTITGLLLIALGLLLGAFAVGSLVNRNLATPPVVLEKIAGMGAGAVFLLSLTVVWFNPINAVVLLSVGSQAASIGVSTGALLVSLTAFTMLATAPFIAVAVFLVWSGERATAALDRINQRLIDHYRAIMTAVLALLGLLLIAEGLGSLLD